MERTYDTLHKKCECKLTFEDGKKILEGTYVRNGQNMSFMIKRERKFSVLSINVNGKHFMKIFKGREHEEDASCELLAAFRRIEGAAEFFRDYKGR